MTETIRAHGHLIGDNEIFDGDVIENHNPANRNAIVAKYHYGSQQLMSDAVGASRDAFPRWAEYTMRDRSEMVHRAAALMDTPQWRQRLTEAMINEIGKTAAGAAGEVEKAVRILRYMAGLGLHKTEDVFHADQPGAHMYTTQEPVGVAGLVTPFNFPTAVLIWKMVAALLAGDTVVVKPSPYAPKTTALLYELFQQAIESTRKTLKDSEFGKGVISVVHGGPEVVEALVKDIRVMAISATGSTKMGKDILKWAMTREKPLDPRHILAEMGGQNALAVAEDGNVDAAVNASIAGAFGGEGQRCTATSRFVLDTRVADEFIAKLCEKTALLKVGPGIYPENQVGPLISHSAVESAIMAVNQSVTNGMNLLHGGSRLTRGDLADGNFMEPTILQGDPNNQGHLALHDEIFAPVAGVAIVDGFDEMMDVINNTVVHRHVASLYTRDLERAFAFTRAAKVGMAHVNNPTMGGDAQAPFGGFGGDTSFGPREMGPRALEVFQRDKTVDINVGGGAVGPR